VSDRPPESWVESEPGIVEREKAAMAQRAPEMVWRDNLVWMQRRLAYGWAGPAPSWAADRPKPLGVDGLLAGRHLELVVIYPEAFPSVPASLFPTDPDVPLDRRTLSRWHVNGDGSLCLMQAASDWQPTDTAAALVRKAAGWFIEYLLVDAGEIEQMTERGIFEDPSLDEVLAKYAS
jgi:hypothetical protein